MHPQLAKFRTLAQDLLNRRALNKLNQRLNPSHALDPSIYGRPDSIALEYIEKQIQKHVRAELLGISFDGRSRLNVHSSAELRICVLARSDRGHLIKADFQYSPQAGQKIVDMEVVGNWGVQEKIGVGKDGMGQWTWFSQKSNSPTEFVVEHIDTTVEKRIASTKGLSFVVEYGDPTIGPRLHRADQLAFAKKLIELLEDEIKEAAIKIQTRERENSIESGALPDQKYEMERLRRLLPESQIDKAFAAQERERLREATETKTQSGQAPFDQAAFDSGGITAQVFDPKNSGERVLRAKRL